MQVNFNGTLDDFRALMSCLGSQHGGREWTLPSGTRLVVEDRPSSDPTVQMASWAVRIPIDVEGSNKRSAIIHAFGRNARSAVILFQDRRSISQNQISLGEIQVLGPDRAIGQPFDELCQELLREMNDWTQSASIRTIDLSEPARQRSRAVWETLVE